MKRIFSTLMIIAAAAMSFTSCQKQEVKDSEMIQVSGLTFTSEKPSFDDETKTEWTGETIQWSKGDKIRIAYTCNGIWQNAEGTAEKDEPSGEKTAKIYASSALEAAAEIAKFIVPEYFQSATEGIYEFYGLYPSTVCSSTNMKYAPSVTVEIPAEQTPSTESFDAKADLMAAKSPQTYTGIPDDPISLLWTRIVAHGHLTLKELQTVGEEKISTITLTADGEADMVGQHYLYLDTYNVVKANGNNTANVLTINADNLSIDGGNVTFWASFLPCVVKSLTVEVETDMATYTRIIETCSLDFKQNARNILSINMASAERVEKEEDTSDYSGIYAIHTKRSSGNYYYMTNDLGSASTKRFTAEEAGNTLPEAGVEIGSSKLWEVSKSDDYYVVRSVGSDKYITWTSGNSATLGDEGILFTITQNDDGLYNLMYKASDSDRYLSLNNTSGNNYFALYKSGQAMNLALIPAVQSEEPDPTPVELVMSEVTCSNQTENSLPFIWTAGDGATAYQVYFDSEDKGTITDLTYTASGLEAGTSHTIAVKAVGDNVNYTTSSSKTCTASTTSASQGGEDPVQSITVSKTIADIAVANNWTDATQYKTVNLSDEITVTVDGGGNTGKYYLNGNNWRLYQTESATLTISSAVGYTINSVKITYDVSSGGTLMSGSSRIESATLYNVNESTVTYSVGNTGNATKGQVRVTAIEVVYQAN